jgi:hypothetical protein
MWNINGDVLVGLILLDELGQFLGIQTPVVLFPIVHGLEDTLTVLTTVAGSHRRGTGSQ